MGYESTERTVGYGTGSTVISVEKYEVDDIEGLLLEVHEELETINDLLQNRLEELEEMQSKHLDTFCEEIEVILKQLAEIRSAVNYTVINNSKINDLLEKYDKQIKMKVIEKIGGTI